MQAQFLHAVIDAIIFQVFLYVDSIIDEFVLKVRILNLVLLYLENEFCKLINDYTCITWVDI